MVDWQWFFGNTHWVYITLGESGWSVGWQQLFVDTHWINTILVWGQVEEVDNSLMETHTGATSHWFEGRLKRLTIARWRHTLEQHHSGLRAGWRGWQLLYGDTHWTSITLGWGQVEEVVSCSMETHTGPASHWVEGMLKRLSIALWRHTLDQHHTGLRAGWRGCQLLYGDTHWTSITLGWGQVEDVVNCSMKTHTGPASHWVEGRWKKLSIALWQHTLDQQHTGLRAGWRGCQLLYGDTHWTSITLGWGQVEEVVSCSMETHTGPASHWVEGMLKRLSIALWRHTLDQHHTGLRAGWRGCQLLYGDTHWTSITLGWGQVEDVDNTCSSMETHTGPASHWIEGGLRAGWRGCQLLYGDTHWTSITLGWGQVEEVDNSSMETHTGPASHWVEGRLKRLSIGLWRHTLDQHHTGLRAGWRGWQLLYGDTHWTSITLGWGQVEEVVNCSMETHTGPASHWVEGRLKRLSVALWRHTLDQHHTGLRAGWRGCQLLYGDTHWTSITLGWGQVEEVVNCSMETHTGPASHWVEGRLKRLSIALWRHILDQHHTGLRAGWRSCQLLYGDTPGPASHWVEGRLKMLTIHVALWRHTLDQHHTGLRAGWRGCQLLYGDTHWTSITLGWGQVEEVVSCSMETHTGPASHWVEEVEEVVNCSMETHTGPASHWVEGMLKRLSIALWRHTLNQHHTGLRAGWRGWQLLYGDTHHSTPPWTHWFSVTSGKDWN